jgi:hypothetical protein
MLFLWKLQGGIIMPIGEKEIKEEKSRQKKVMSDLKKEIVVFFQKKRLEDKLYHHTDELEIYLREEGFSFTEDKFQSNKEWMEYYLDGKSTIGAFFVLEKIDHRNDTYYRYRYKRWAKICSMFRK